MIKKNIDMFLKIIKSVKIFVFLWNLIYFEECVGFVRLNLFVLNLVWYVRLFIEKK